MANEKEIIKDINNIYLPFDDTIINFDWKIKNR